MPPNKDQALKKKSTKFITIPLCLLGSIEYWLLQDLCEVFVWKLKLDGVRGNILMIND